MQLYLRSPISFHCLHTDMPCTFRNYKAPHCAILVSLLLPHSLVKILPTLRQTSSVHTSPLQQGVQIQHTHIKQRMELCHIECGKICFHEQSRQVGNFKTKCKRKWTPIPRSKYTWDNLLLHSKGSLYLQFCTRLVRPRYKVATAMVM